MAAWETDMTPDERQMLADLFERIRANAAGPRDAQAEAFINDAVRALPFSPYVLAQTVLVQQHALEGAAQRVQELEAQLAAHAAAPAQETSFLGGLGRSLFGSAPAAAPPPSRGYDASSYQRGSAQAQPSYAPPPQPGPWGAAPSTGGGFLSGALHTAAGVAGGMMLANTLESLIGGRGAGLFGGSGFAGSGFGGRETINNFYQSAPDAAGQHAEDVLQDMDQDQDDAQDAGYDDGGGSDA